MVTSYTGVFGGNAIQPAQTSYSKIDLDADVQLSWPTSFVDTKNVVSGIIEVDASTPDLNLYFPNAQLTSLGTLVIITNVGADTFNVMKFGSAPDGLPILVAPPGSTNCIYLTNNSDNEGGIGGSWTAVPYGTGSTAISSISLESDDESLVIDNGVINNTGEVVQFNLADNLNSLGGMTAAGIAVQDGANGWVPRSITGMGNNITVTNGDGVLGNPSISLTADVDGLEKISVAQLVLENNTLSSSTNNNLNLAAAGGKDVLIGSGANQVEIDTNGNLITSSSGADSGNIIIGGALTTPMIYSPVTLSTYASFQYVDSSTPINIQKSFNILSILILTPPLVQTNTLQINFTNPLSDTTRIPFGLTTPPTVGDPMIPLRIISNPNPSFIQIQAPANGTTVTLLIFGGY